MDKIFKFLMVNIVFFMLMPSVYAEEAILNGIEVKPLNNSYEITIDTNQAVPLKTISSQSDKLTIELKNIMPSKAVNTVYNNANNIDHVLIQPVGNDLKVMIQGLNVASSQVLLDSPKVPSQLINAPADTQEITLNRSIDSYSPVVMEENNDFSDVFSLTSFDLKNLLTPSSMGWLIGLFFILMVLVKNMRETKEQAKKYEDFSPKDILRQKEEFTKKAKEVDLQSEISKAQQKFKEGLVRKQEIPNQNAALKNYGLKEYQNSQTNPYTKVSKKTDNMTAPIQNASEQKPKLNKLQEAVQAINQKNNPAMAAQQQNQEKVATFKPSERDIEKAQARLNNLKFLENMTKIYEKSGRVDLAQNIKEKVRQKNI